MLKAFATIFCLIFIFYLFRIDSLKNKNNFSSALWIPFLSLAFSSSREVSYWLNFFLGIGDYYSASLTEGNIIERIFQSCLLISALIVLLRRNIQWKTLIRKNAAIFVYFLFGLISILWSDYTSISFKRYIKTFGSILFVLIILTEQKPYAALGQLIKRFAYLFLPLSILFIRYYPDIGISYHGFSGTQMYTGVAGSKNGLGAICLYTSIFFIWNFFYVRKSQENRLGQPISNTDYLIFVPMIFLLLYKANSATALVCVFIAVGIFLISRTRVVARSPSNLMYVCLGLIFIFVMLDYSFELKNSAISLLGRRPDLTTRIPMWPDLISMVRNPVIGFGFESFWLGERLKYVQETWGVFQAHNGYIETYLNLGGVGVGLLILWITIGYKKIYSCLMSDYSVGVLRFCLLTVVCVYNFTEATFYGKGVMWAFFFISTIDMSDQTPSSINTK